LICILGNDIFPYKRFKLVVSAFQVNYKPRSTVRIFCVYTLVSQYGHDSFYYEYYSNYMDDKFDLYMLLGPLDMGT
jgi:hypothetical protein